MGEPKRFEEFRRETHKLGELIELNIARAKDRGADVGIFQLDLNNYRRQFFDIKIPENPGPAYDYRKAMKKIIWLRNRFKNLLEEVRKS
jgi:hypothetical protein